MSSGRRARPARLPRRGGRRNLPVHGRGRHRAGRSPKDVARVDAAAAALPRPAAARRDPIDRAQFPTPDPQPGGQRREYWIGARTVSWDIVPTGRDEWMKHRAPVALQAHDPRLRLPAVERGLRRADRSRAHARADPVRRGRRRDRRPLQQPRPQAAPGGHDAPARGPLQPRVRRRLPRRLHARGGLRGTGRGVHLRLGGHAGLGRRRGRTTTMAPTTRSTRSGACSGR